MKSYFIRHDYKINPVPTTSEQFGDHLYWDKARIAASRVYQYYVYRDAITVARRNHVKTLCDVGCGTGEKLRALHAALPDVRIVGIDQTHAIDYCRKHHNFGEWLVDDLARPRLDLCCDMSICSDVIEHLADPDVLLDYLKRVTRPGGAVLLSTPDRDRFRGETCKHSPNRDHVREWSSGEFIRYLESHGFVLLQHYHVPAVRYSLSKAFVQEVVWRVLSGRIVSYTQVALVQNPG